MNNSKASTLVAVTAAGAIYGASVSAEDWPQWRGPAATGVSSETGLPLK